jgi:Na+/phosphate symporter
MENEEFNKVIRRGINKNGSSNSDKLEKIIENLNYDIEKLSDITCNLVNDASKSRRHGIEKEIRTLMDSFNKTRSATNDVLGSGLKNLKMH